MEILRLLVPALGACAECCDNECDRDACEGARVEASATLSDV
jgi:hypothetical protein